MSSDPREAIAAQLREEGRVAMLAEEWTPDRALSVLRENRRRYASNPQAQAVSGWGAGLAEDIIRQTGLSAADVSAVLLYASSWLGGIAAVHRLPVAALTSVMGAAADDLDRQANGGEPR